MKMYMVGGAVRDEILGVPSKDIDFTVVLEDEFYEDGYDRRGNTPFEAMTLELKRQGFKIFLETPEYLTVRAQFPDYKTARRFAGDHVGGRITADFVLARRESDYTDGRRPDVVIPGTLEDDLARRDFSMNAIAKDSDGNLIDPFNGVEDIRDAIIRAVGDPYERLREDALRAVRAIRFAVTKGFTIEPQLRYALEYKFVTDAIRNKISDERIDVELSKMFRYDTVASLKILNQFPCLTDAIFSGTVSLDATMKLRGRGK